MLFPRILREPWILLSFLFAGALLAGGGAALGITWGEVATESSCPPRVWPYAAASAHSSSLPTLVVFVQPHCPESRDALTELNRLISEVRSRFTTIVYVVGRAEDTRDRPFARLLNHLAQRPGVHLHDDPQREDAALFGAHWAGQAMLYGLSGELLCQGQFVSTGPGSGRDRFRAVLLELPFDSQAPPISGCPLRTAESPNA